MDTPTLLAHLEHHDTALTLPRGAALRWDDAGLHRAAHTEDAEGYALLGLAPGVRPWQRARVLLQILAASQAGLDDRTRAVQARVARVLTLGLPPGHVITALLALRRLRANHKHTTRAALRFVLEHPGADALIAARRPALLDCFEHALGTATARGCARRIDAGDTASDYLRRRLLRFLTDPAAAPARVQALYRAGEHAGDPAGPLPDEPVLAVDAVRERPATITATNRGDIAATLVHLYRGGPAEDLYVALGRYVGDAASAFPRFPGTVALVLDASASMRGYGDREWAVLSQAVALRMVLSQVCDRVEVVEAGGDERAPRGATDLAAGVLDALGTGPDLVAVVSDGYENVFPGDLARVAASLPGAGITVPVVFCHALFTGSDDLALRRPAPSLPQRGFWHQDDFAELLPWMFGHCAAGAPWLRAALHARLDVLDRQADGLTARIAA
ncbi:VWA domain-containing protein [Actinomadura darangshiensis]|uniref:VWA domain-containing protein n=1 Tax=Actinomadura darangshiensis TaxID=705336 RepID=A0A4R5A255_9ACTN|nr:VWA domain-containing protein [Actinomadura darangshiensis]TDD63542.1 VWA domain-containing protein [Actinomadura darangshiensis]